MGHEARRARNRYFKRFVLTYEGGVITTAFTRAMSRLSVTFNESNLQFAWNCRAEYYESDIIHTYRAYFGTGFGWMGWDGWPEQRSVQGTSADAASLGVNYRVVTR